MPDKIKGGCLCGAVRYKFTENKGFNLRCYCRDCQHISGAGHLPQAIVSRSSLELTGPVSTYQWESDSGNELELGFCKICGSPIYKTTSMAPKKIAVLVGSLDNSDHYTIDRNVYEISRMLWDVT